MGFHHSKWVNGPVPFFSSRQQKGESKGNNIVTALSLSGWQHKSWWYPLFLFADLLSRNPRAKRRSNDFFLSRRAAKSDILTEPSLLCVPSIWLSVLLKPYPSLIRITLAACALLPSPRWFWLSPFCSTTREIIRNFIVLLRVGNRQFVMSKRGPLWRTFDTSNNGNGRQIRLRISRLNRHDVICRQNALQLSKSGGWGRRWQLVDITIKLTQKKS